VIFLLNNKYLMSLRFQSKASLGLIVYLQPFYAKLANSGKITKFGGGGGLEVRYLSLMSAYAGFLEPRVSTALEVFESWGSKQ